MTDSITENTEALEDVVAESVDAPAIDPRNEAPEQTFADFGVSEAVAGSSRTSASCTPSRSSRSPSRWR